MSITTVTAAENVCLSNIAALAADLGAALNSGRPVRLDLSAVILPDLSVVQLVQSARASAAYEGLDFALSTPAGGTLHALLDRAGFIANISGEDTQFWFHGDIVR